MFRDRTFFVPSRATVAMTAPPLELRILGPTTLAGSGLDLADAEVRAPKRLALFAYLAMETAEGFRRRDHIVSVFWPDLSQEAARTQLRKALFGLRRSVGSDAVLTRGDGEVRLDADAVWCDAVAFERCIAGKRWEEALGLYRGDLLEGLYPGNVAQEFHDWLDDKRKTLRRQAARAAWECARIEESRGDRKAATVLARRARDLVPDDEEAVRRLMELLDRQGDRGGALRVYHDWQTWLQAEFGVEPAPETRKLARRVQAARKGESHETPPTPPLNSAPPATQPTAPAAAAWATPGHTLRALGPSAPAARRPAWLMHPLLRWGALLLLLAAAAAGVAIRRGGEEQPPPHSVAIRALRVGSDSIAATIGTIFEEELTTALIAVGGLDVRPELRGRRPGDTVEATPPAGRPLRVAFVVDGGVYRRGVGVRINLRLVRTADGVATWAAAHDLLSTAPDAVQLSSAAAASAAIIKARVDAESRRVARAAR